MDACVTKPFNIEFLRLPLVVNNFKVDFITPPIESAIDLVPDLKIEKNSTDAFLKFVNTDFAASIDFVVPVIASSIFLKIDATRVQGYMS